nr:MAG TPA: hypothetical protein [Caudoviricetes sp.]DAW29513.1 MAG TPA: hypothetical protein [Caudoviricetes sp.]
MYTIFRLSLYIIKYQNIVKPFIYRTFESV